MKKTRSNQDLDAAGPMPEFRNPPVVEVACSVQFEELSRFQAPYAGFLWQQFREEYSAFEEKAPLPHVVETFPEPRQPELKWELSDLPPPRRIFFVTGAGNNVIQIQPDRFVHNWRKIGDEEEYPRYTRVREVFLEQWSRLVDFVQRHSLGPVRPDQYELTYVNHFLHGEEWDSLADIGKVFRDMAWAGGKRFLPVPEGTFLSQSFAMPGEKGRLHCTLRKARRTKDAREVLIFELTARGFPGGQDTTGREAMLAWFDMAHEWIVRGFVDLTSTAAQERLWGRTQ